MYFLEKATIKPVTCHATLGLGNDYFQFQSAEVINSRIHLHGKVYYNVLFLLCSVILLILIQNIIIHLLNFFLLKKCRIYILFSVENTGNTKWNVITYYKKYGHLWQDEGFSRMWLPLWIINQHVNEVFSTFTENREGKYMNSLLYTSYI